MGERLNHLIAKGGLKMPVTRRQARKIIGQMSKEYEKASKSEKSGIITSIVGLTGFMRSSVARGLRSSASTSQSKPKQPGKKRGLFYVKSISRNERDDFPESAREFPGFGRLYGLVTFVS